jgi:hypothetical protein
VIAHNTTAQEQRAQMWRTWNVVAGTWTMTQGVAPDDGDAAQGLLAHAVEMERAAPSRGLRRDRPR